MRALCSHRCVYFAHENIDQAEARGLSAVIEDFVFSMPSAKVTSTAPATLPSLVLAVTGNRSVSAANAFSPAVQGRDITRESARRMLNHVQRAERLTGATIHALALDAAGDEVLAGADASTFIQADDLNELIKATR